MLLPEVVENVFWGDPGNRSSAHRLKAFPSPLPEQASYERQNNG
jgi:hypothetical protein